MISSWVQRSAQTFALSVVQITTGAMSSHVRRCPGGGHDYRRAYMIEGEGFDIGRQRYVDGTTCRRCASGLRLQGRHSPPMAIR